jgi:hypothetical protein
LCRGPLPAFSSRSQRLAVRCALALTTLCCFVLL